MDETLDPALLAEIEDLRDETALKEAILESLNETRGDGDNDEDEDLRRTARKELKRLRKHLRALQPAAKHEDDDGSPGQDLDQIPETRTNDTAPGTFDPADHLMPPPKYDLVSRKRQRDDFDYDEKPESSKSRRTTPSSALTAAPSPAESSTSFDSLDDPFLDSLFGGLSKEEVESNQEFWNKREHKQRQEEVDARLAQSLSQEWAEDVDEETQFAATRNADYTQSFLRPDGSVNRRSVGHLSGVKPELDEDDDERTSFVKSEPLVNPRSLATIKAEDGSSFMPTGPSVPDNATSTSSSRIAVKHEPGAGYSSMPGAFPGFSAPQQSYDSIGGQSVYSNVGTLQPDGTQNSYGTPLPGPLDPPFGDPSLADPFGRSTRIPSRH